MWDIFRRNPTTLVVAVLMHLAIIGFMIVGLDWLKPPEPKVRQVNVVQAKLVDSTKLEQAKQEKQRQIELERKKKQEAERKKQEQARKQEKARKKAEAEKKQKAEAERKKKAEAERKKKLEAKKKAEARKKAEAEKKRKAEAERKKKAEAERKRKEEAARKKAEAEKQRKAEAERKRQAEADRKRREAEMRAQLEAEQDATESSAVSAAIRAKIQNNWLRPPGAVEKGLKCTVRVRLAENGSVLLAQVVESSGNGAFDRSVESAVYKADPLPMPTSPRLISAFRELNLVFDPAK